MKTKSLFLAMLVALSTTALAVGKDKPEMTVVSVKGSEVFKVIYKGAAIGKVRLNIFDGQGKMIHSETITEIDGFICPLNFRGLPSGDYIIEVVDQDGKYRETVSYMPAYDRKTIHVSKLRSEDSKYLLAIANAQNEPMRITIYDAGGSVVFDEQKVINGDFARVFKIKQPYGRYTFKVSDGRGTEKRFSF